MTETVTTRMSIQQAVDGYTEYLVEAADDTISEKKMKALRKVGKNNQFSNFLAVTQATDSPAAVRNWVLYQMGRRDMRRVWKETGLGEDVVKQVDRLAKQARQAAAEIYGDGASKGQVREIQMLMVRQYAGYLRRWFVARGGQE